MRAIGLAIVALALALFAPSASAATVKLEVIFCGCDGSSGDADIRNIILTAAPGEHNAVGVERSTRGIVITDDGAPLTGELPAHAQRRRALLRRQLRHRGR